VRLFKKLFLFLFALSAVYILAFISVNFIFQSQIKSLLERRLGAYVGAEVDIKNFKTNLLTQLNFGSIHIKRKTNPAFYLAISSVNFKYSPLSLLQFRFKGKIELEGLRGTVKIRGNILLNFSFKIHSFNKVIEIEELNLFLQDCPVLRAKGAIRPLFKPQTLTFEARIPSLTYSALNIRNSVIKLNISKDESFGGCFIEALNYNKFSPSNINLKSIFKDKKIRLEDLEMDIFEGRLKGRGIISFLPVMGCELNLAMAGLNLKEITDRLAPPQWQATGAIKGDLHLSLEGGLKDLKGRLYSQRPGTVNMEAIRRLLGAAGIIDKSILKQNTFFYENLNSDISLLKGVIIVKLLLKAKNAELKFDINIEPQVLGSFLNRR